MKKTNTVLVMGLIGLLGFSLAGVPAFASINIQAADDWLASKANAAPKVNMTGKWDAGSAWAGGWGEGNFIQDKANFTGPLGLYYVKGVVSGKDLYLVLLSNNRVYYTAQMTKQSDGSFSGKATKEVFVDSDAAKSAETYPITFRKM